MTPLFTATTKVLNPKSMRLLLSFSIKIELLNDFLPTDLPSSLLLRVQVNIFNCGGLVIGINISHILADGFTLGSFVKEWAHITQTGTTKDCLQSYGHLSSLFPPTVLSGPQVQQNALGNLYVTVVASVEANQLRNELNGFVNVVGSTTRDTSASIDFGWGKPFWVSSVSKPFEVFILNDTKDGDGIEACMVLFHYLPSNTEGTITERCDKLQKSLAQTLTKFFPIAGRLIEGEFSIHCNDKGIEYVETKVNADLAEFLHQGPNTELLNDFLPWPSTVPPYSDLPSTPLLAVQVNLFNCGGQS
ncbi:hypothetical protein MTR67_005997 [Solanum verrucosum]|uniref:Uncharacterized protein n=1 Tax=Solanum verrucosum TaxID=315347 RepID=A0AAF0PXD4_SOLVR|nr:hypothetical protein MTR67_005997 [Solanum verrucosum]